jgi:tetratricopeptide (TPR) repeat protein
MGALSPTDDPALQRAQELLYDAWEERSPKRRIGLAHRALETSPNCADAYVLLAEDEAATAQQELDLYAAGVQAGRRALGEPFFRDQGNAGHFWGILETRPFMRAFAGLAGAQWKLDRREEALANYRELLRLNPGDNQGIRYLLLRLLLELCREDEAQALLKDYEEDWSTDWVYTAALLAFRREGDVPLARRALEKAVEQNIHVPPYLVGKKRIPPSHPELITMGGPDEAAAYAADYLNDWRKTPGAVEWLGQRVGTK